MGTGVAPSPSIDAVPKKDVFTASFQCDDSCRARLEKAQVLSAEHSAGESERVRGGVQHGVWRGYTRLGHTCSEARGKARHDRPAPVRALVRHARHLVRRSAPGPRLQRAL